MASREEDELDKQFEASINSKPETAQQKKDNIGVIPKTPTQSMAVPLGLMSGALSSFAPQVVGALSTGFGLAGDYAKARDAHAERNQAAWDAHPGTYGAAYTTGALGSAAATGGAAPVLKGMFGAAKAAKAAGIPAMRATLNIMGELGKGAGSGISNLMSMSGRDVVRGLSGPGAIPGVATRLFGEGINTPEGGSVPAAIKPRAPAGAPVSMLEEETDVVNPYRQLTEYLAQNSDPNDLDSKRKLAMQMNSTPEGRAISNSTYEG